MTSPALVPVRISSLNSLSRCAGFMALSEVTERNSKAADTGSCTGRIVQLWHELGDFEAAAAKAHGELEAAYPLAVWDEARDMAISYAGDPRNQGRLPQFGVVEPGSCEREVRLTLPADEDDPTSQPVELVGHVDQLRRIYGYLSVWDIKAGKKHGGKEMVFEHAWQLAAYALAVEQTLGEPCNVGGIIRMRGYVWNRRCQWNPENLAEAPVFYYAPFTREQCLTMLGTVAWLVGQLRRGLVPLQPGLSCVYCPGGGPHVCAEKIGEAFEHT